MATDASRYFCDARRSVAVLARQVLEDIPAGIFDCHLPFTDVRRNERAVASQGKIAATHFPDMTGWQVATSRICPCRWLPQAP